MKKIVKNRAFTLIELLVVVLIIGILAAVAVPQYRLAVGKTKLAQLFLLASTLKQANEAYYLANGNYTTSWKALDIVPPANNSTTSFVLHTDDVGHPASIYARDEQLSGVLLIVPFSHSTFGSNRCYAVSDNLLANQLCKNFTTRSAYKTNDGGYNKYIF